MKYCADFIKTENVDVLVIGGGPAGVSAAVSAARCGADTLIAERFGVLGGMLTAGRVDPILGAVSEGTMYDEIVSLLAEKHPDSKPHVTRNGKEVQVDPEEAKTILMNFVHKSGARCYLQTSVIDVIKEDDKVLGAVLSAPMGLIAVYAKCVIDATGDGFAAFKAGAEYKIGRDSDGTCQPTTIEFVVDGVDETRGITCWGGTDPVTLPSGQKYSEFCKEANKRGELPKNVSIVRLHRTHYSGERSVNATQANGYDTLSPQGISDALYDLRNQVDVVTEFLRKNVPGFENCRVKASADALGVRETRRIMGEYVLCDNDVETGARFDDVLVHKAWFLIDIHNPTGGGQAEKHSQPAVPYDIPYRCFLPKKIENLLVAGRCISGTHRAHGSYRVMSICMAMGEAVGIAAAISSEKNIAPRNIDAKEIQKVLQDRGVVLFD